MRRLVLDRWWWRPCTVATALRFRSENKYRQLELYGQAPNIIILTIDPKAHINSENARNRNIYGVKVVLWMEIMEADNTKT